MSPETNQLEFCLKTRLIYTSFFHCCFFFFNFLSIPFGFLSTHPAKWFKGKPLTPAALTIFHPILTKAPLTKISKQPSFFTIYFSYLFNYQIFNGVMLAKKEKNGQIAQNHTELKDNFLFLPLSNPLAFSRKLLKTLWCVSFIIFWCQNLWVSILHMQVCLYKIFFIFSAGSFPFPSMCLLAFLILF